MKLIKILKNKWVYLPIIFTAVFIAVCAAWLSCKTFACKLISGRETELVDFTLRLVPKIVLLIIIFIIFKVISSLFFDVFYKKFTKRFAHFENYSGVVKVLRFVLWTCFFFISLSVFIGDLGTFLTSLGLIGFGLTFGLQKPISNFVGWLTIIIKGLYKEGDRIQIGDIKGDVKEIQIMNTVLGHVLEGTDSKDMKVVTLPNEFVLSQAVKNFTKEENYILDVLKISITYESDYKKAMKLFEKIIYNQIKNNRKEYVKQIKQKKDQINEYIKELYNKENKDTSKTDKILDKELDKQLELEAKTLQANKEELTQQLKIMEGLEEEFKPRIRLEMSDSSITLVALFLTPYNQIKKNRSEINIAFLDAIHKDKDIEIAYPHMQIIKSK